MFFPVCSAFHKLSVSQGDQPHCGFPEKNFESNVEKLACKVSFKPLQFLVYHNKLISLWRIYLFDCCDGQGYRVLVVEQTETPDQLDKRRKQDGSKDKVSN